ncbi:MAG TPA: hypothetical protein VH040_09480 [Usitatibacter sp.]|nr:hypothetical protein [Usitatibacter sp.]
MKPMAVCLCTVLALLSGLACASDPQPISYVSPTGATLALVQQANGHVIANWSAKFPSDCSFGLGYYFSNKFLTITVNPESPCYPWDTASVVPYATSLDLGVIDDGDYTLNWYFEEPLFGPVGDAHLQSFSIRNGALQFSVTRGVTGLWWNPQEPGWGVFLSQRGNIVFAAIYTYDASGNPKWYVAPDCMLFSASLGGEPCGSFLYEVSGPRFFAAPFDSSSAKTFNVGGVTLSFADENTGTLKLQYELDPAVNYDPATAYTRTVQIQREIFPVARTAPPRIDYTDLWWNPAEPGWGLAITQQFNNIFLAWYVYDSAGKPAWYVAPSCVVNDAQDGCAGPLFRTTGPALSTTFDSSAVRVFGAGSVSIAFSDANTGTISYTVDGVSSSKPISREVFN